MPPHEPRSWHQRYLDKSGDASVRLRQHLSETAEDMHRLLGCLDRVIRNIDAGFHELLPPLQEPIAAHAREVARRKALGARR